LECFEAAYSAKPESLARLPLQYQSQEFLA